MDNALTTERIAKAARTARPLTVKSYTLPRQIEAQLAEILGVFLDEIGEDRLKDSLGYCLRELAVNAKKANTKRVYFQEKGLDIHDSDDYRIGMLTFRDETLENMDYYLQQQKEQGYYVRVVFHTKNRVLQVAVCNNAEITRYEQMRIFDRIARSRAYSSLEDAMENILDDTEGAGLGIVIMVLMLRRLGLDEDAFDVDVRNGETVAQLRIPINQVHAEYLDAISGRIAREVEALPRFPENITRLQRMIHDPDVTLRAIADQISVDPSLTADLLKVVNSAQFMLPKRVDNITEAVKLVGLRGLNHLLYSYGTQKILGYNTQETRALWEHSYQTGFYAYHIARNIGQNGDILDDVYVGGILHDMGKIIFSAGNPEFIRRIEKFCDRRGIPTKILERLASGANHGQIGGMMAEKWNFPDALIEAIRWHHEPNRCDPVYREVVYAVYLANALCDLHSDSISIDEIEPAVRERYGLNNQEQLDALKKRLRNEFRRRQVA